MSAAEATRRPPRREAMRNVNASEDRELMGPFGERWTAGRAQQDNSAKRFSGRRKSR
jgi:hypothetical protein